MTASVSTRGMKGACFSDVERENMYAGALSYYIHSLLSSDSGHSIVFVDNSGWDLERLKAKLPEYDSSRIEFISLPPDNFDISKGKGYNELLLITGGVKTSNFINKSGAFFKVTGRYPIYNLGKLISDGTKAIESKGLDLYCDIKDHKLYDWLKLGWNGHSFDCRLFAVKSDFYLSEIAPLYAQCDDYAPGGGKLLEDVLFRFVKSHPGNYSLRFRREPQFGGVEGSNVSAISFSKNQDSMKGKLKRVVGNAIRIFTPWFKF